MKNIVRKILPQPVFLAARDLRSRGLLSAVPSLGLDPSRLRAAADVDVAALLSDRGTDAAWRAAEEDIRSVFPQIDLLDGINPGDRRALYYLVSGLKPRRVLEIGTHIGASTLHIALALENAGPEATVTTVDIVDVNDPQTGPWKKRGLPMPPRAYAEKLGCAGRIAFRTYPALKFMALTENKYDLIFLDGDHAASSVYREVAAALPLLTEGGVILLHDYYPGAQALFPDGNVISGPFGALERVRCENPALAVLPLGALPWETKQGSRMTSLALLARRS